MGNSPFLFASIHPFHGTSTFLGEGMHIFLWPVCMVQVQIGLHVRNWPFDKAALCVVQSHGTSPRSRNDRTIALEVCVIAPRRNCMKEMALHRKRASRREEVEE